MYQTYREKIVKIISKVFIDNPVILEIEFMR